MTKYYLAVDVGATSGRHILAHRNGAGELEIEEIYRFSTPLVQEEDEHCYWDVQKLFEEVLTGLKKAKALGKIPSRIGIDTFGVDYALLDQQDQLVGHVRSYRDIRTSPFRESFLSPERIYQLTGIQPHAFDTVYQLAADKDSGKLAKATQAIMLPSYLAYLLTGKKQNELSILSTSALMNARTYRFVPEIMDALGIDSNFFPSPIEAGNKIGSFLPEVAKEVGFDAVVYAALEHDTAAAFFGSGAKEGDALLSSGTWSLLGVVLKEPIITEESYRLGLTNEWSHRHEVRFLENITGMWLINRLMKEDPEQPDILTVVKEAEASQSFEGTLNVLEGRLMNPESMKEMVDALIVENGGVAPKTFGERYYAIYHSLALCYRDAIRKLETMTGRNFSALCVFGGGSKNRFLNELTSRVAELPVHTGPAEATAIGNILSIEG